MRTCEENGSANNQPAVFTDVLRKSSAFSSVSNKSAQHTGQKYDTDAVSAAGSSWWPEPKSNVTKIFTLRLKPNEPIWASHSGQVAIIEAVISWTMV